MYNSFGETLANEWTPKTVCESRADWLKFEDLSNRDQLGVCVFPTTVIYGSIPIVVRPLLTRLFRFGRFNTFETSLRDIDGLLQNWDRTTGTVVRADTPKSENFDDTLPAPGSTRRNRDKKDKEKELREREKEREREKAKEVGVLS